MKTLLHFFFTLILAVNAQAQQIPDSNQTTHRISAEPPGYYDAAAGLSCASLKTALNTIITAGMIPRTYGELWTQYLLSDIKPREVGPGVSVNVIWDMYSDSVTGPDPYNFTPGTVMSGGQQDNGTNAPTEGIFYNREHTIPLSWFNGSTGTPGPATDYFHVFPTDKKVNADRANFIYGVVTTPTITSANWSKLGPNTIPDLAGTAFEPVNGYKGDIARAFFYFVTRYELDMPAWESLSPDGDKAFDGTLWPSIELPYLKMMLAWHNADAVSLKELDRNDAGYTYQGNRNPYIDHPEFVGEVWSPACGLLLPADITIFTASYRNSQVLLQWNIERADGLQGFEVQRSVDGGSHFQGIGNVSWIAGQNDYSFTDNASSLSGPVLYRLKITDNNLVYKYSNTVAVKIPAAFNITLSPNPSNGHIIASFRSVNTQRWQVTVSDFAGRVLMRSQWQPGQQNYLLDAQRLQQGAYVLSVANEENVRSVPFVIQR